MDMITVVKLFSDLSYLPYAIFIYPSQSRMLINIIIGLYYKYIMLYSICCMYIGLDIRHIIYYLD